MTLDVRAVHPSLCPLTSPSLRDCDHQVHDATRARRRHVCARHEPRKRRHQGEMGPRRSGREPGDRGLDSGETLRACIPPALTAPQNIYYRRTRRLDIPLVTDLRLLPSGEAPTPLTDPWVKVEHSIRDGVLRADPLYLWYKTGKTMQEMGAEEKNNIITEIDILFGEDRAWFGFEKLDPPVTPEQEGRISSVFVTYRRGVKRESTGSARSDAR
jgi:hypothetical protein